MPNPLLNPAGSPLFRDRHDTRVSAWLHPWDGVEQPDVIFVGAPLSRTSISHSGASQLPAALRELFGALTTYNIDHDIDLNSTLTARDAGDVAMHPTDLARCHGNIRDALTQLYADLPHALPVIAGGDQSITRPSIEAFRARVGGPVGLVQLDAHMDLRNLEDGGPTNGTPIRGLIESGTLLGQHIAQIGLHSFANAKPYRDYAVAHGISQVTARRVAHDGIESHIEHALKVAGTGTDAIYVTVDMDVLGQAFAPGVPAMVPGGITPWQLLDAVFRLGTHPRVAAIDIVEVDPTQDFRRATVRLALHAILTFLAGVASRSGADD